MTQIRKRAVGGVLLPLLPLFAIVGSPYTVADNAINLDDISMYVVSEEVRNAKPIQLPARGIIIDSLLENSQQKRPGNNNPEARKDNLNQENLNIKAAEGDAISTTLDEPATRNGGQKNKQNRVIAKTGKAQNDLNDARARNNGSNREARENTRE